jgi:RND family efflux transporter MFP subunit
MNISIVKFLYLLACLTLATPVLAVSDHDDDHDEHGHEEAAQQKTDNKKDEHDESGHHEEAGHKENDHGEHHEEGEHADHEDDHDKEEHSGQDEAGHEEGSSVKLSAEQMAIAGIVSEPIQLSKVSDVIIAPGEVMLNAYKTSSVTPRVSAQVIQRYAKLGDEVSTGQPLLSLSSVEMANAQGKLLVTEREWQRVKKLGRKVVSDSRYIEARVASEQAKARVLAYGMTTKQAADFIKSGDASKANGTFQLLAPQDGTVIKDNFIQGELIEPGRVLFVISDESMLWAEAKLTPSQVKLVSPGNAATITAEGKQFVGRVVQVHHALDEDTRTLGVRVEFANPDDDLHPGVFVRAIISSNEAAPALAIPLNAVLRSPDGDWMVFTEHEAGEFEPQEVELVRTVGDVSVIEGLEPGTRVVTQGAFFVQSELAKSGFDPHNH